MRLLPKKLWNIRPLVIAALCLVFGIALSYQVFIRSSTYWVLLFCVPVVLFFIADVLWRKPKIVCAVLLAVAMVAFFLVGFFAFYARVESYTKATLFPDGEYSVQAKVADKGTTESRYYWVLSELTLDGEEAEGKMYAYTSDKKAWDQIRTGDVVFDRLAVSSQKRDLYTYGKFQTFLLQNDIHYYATAEDIRVTEHKADVFSDIGNLIYDRIFQGMESDVASVAYALTVGDTQFMDEGELQNMRYGGIAHIFAVSGLHIGVVYAVVAWLFRKMGMLPQFAELPAGVAAFLYAGVCGFRPSGVRVLVMCFVRMLAVFLHEKYDRLNALAAAVVVLLLLDPVHLFAVGFQLSVLAVLGMTLLADQIARVLPSKRNWQQKFGQMLAVSLSAQLGMLPVLLDSFGYFSVAGLLLNLIVLPVISVVLPVLLGTCVCACVLPAFSRIFFLFPEWALRGILAFVGLADYSAFLLKGIVFGGWFLLWMVLLWFASDFTDLGKKQKAIVSGVLALILVAGMALQRVELPYSAKVEMSANAYYTQMVYFRTEDCNFLVLASGYSEALTESLTRSQIPDFVLVLGQNERALQLQQKWNVPFYQSSLISEGCFEPVSYVRKGQVTAYFITAKTVRCKIGERNISVSADGEVPLETDLLIGNGFGGTEAEYVASFGKTEKVPSVYGQGNLIFYVRNGIIIPK